MSSLRALFWLSLTLTRRLLREGIVLRSLVFPVGLTAGTLLLTLVVMAWRHGPDLVAVQGDATDPAFVHQLEARGWRVLPSDQPKALIAARTVFAGTDGHQLWVRTLGRKELQLEAIVRGPDAPWVPVPPEHLPRVDQSSLMGRTLSRIMGALFALYGVVFGAGMVARDRDDGTLEAELSLAVPRWVHGASRWLAGSLVLSSFFVLSMLVFNALLGLPDVGAMARHGVAGSATAVAIGLLVIGQGGVKQGFSGPLSLGLTLGSGLMISGLVAPAQAQWLPLGSLATDGGGWAPLAASLLVGLLATIVFTRRTAHS